MRAHFQGEDSSRSRLDRNHYVQAESAGRADIEQLLTSGPSPRSQRFPIETTIYYRKQGSSHWQEGHTLNISESGVLFGAKWASAPRTPVEMTFSLPSGSRNHAGGQVICHGEIVRSERVPGSNALRRVAATIVRYRLAKSTTRR
jgi:hypothetical protein